MTHTSDTPRLTRRELLKLTSAGVVGYSLSGWLGQLAAATTNNPQRRRSCILLWMNGGPSQMDTFDLKPGHANGGPFREIQTAVPGIRISQHLPRLAARARDLAIVRAMSTREADHGRATYQMRTGYLPGGPNQFPTLGSLFSKEMGRADAELPNFVSIAPYPFFSPAAYGPGFLGPQYAPLVLGGDQQALLPIPGQQNNYEDGLRVPDLVPPAGVSTGRTNARVRLLDEMERDFLETRSALSIESHRSAYQRAVTLMRSSATRAFDLDEEPRDLRDRYGRNLFGQGCLLARRLIERGVPFAEVTLATVGNIALGWDTHINNFDTVRRLSEVLDSAWATLLDDLRGRGLLDSTLIVWMGEFGRTPRINPQQGRDHWANSWTTVLAGGGIRGGQVFGRTSADGTAVESERPVSTGDFIATIARALGIDGGRQNISNVGRPIRVVDANARPIQEVLA
ncbi:MAG TPA: DUF1501 domain-containing protein [Gemmataceae bacterium]|nr:DUF1501 domain-containing protein [Gemmataceae bacterium]